VTGAEMGLDYRIW